MRHAPPDAPVDLDRRAHLARLGGLWAAVALASCGGGDAAPSPPSGPVPPAPPGSGSGSPPPGPPPGPAPSPGTPPRLTLLRAYFDDPWGFVFLPDGRMLVTQRGGQMVIADAAGTTVSTPLGGLPGAGVLATGGQGGLLDVALDPDFEAGENWVYFSYSEQIGGVRGTAVNRGRLDLANHRLTDVSMTPLFRQTKDGGEIHYGSRLVFARDKTLFITLGEKGNPARAQDLTSTHGKVVRIHRDGSIPADNPSFGAGAAPGLWSYGHRNPQGAALHPTTGELWLNEHGPQGGDELNIARAGQNYGWPLKSYGCDYGATGANCQIGGGGGVHQPQYAEPVTWWPGPGNTAPYNSIAPSGLMFYDGSGFPEWRGNLFMGALAGTALWRIELSGNTVVARERLFGSASQRIRCVRQGPDGWLYLIATNGGMYRVDR